SDRWLVARLLDEGGHSYREIHALTGVSVTTIGRVARFLQQEPHQGYRLVLDPLRENSPSAALRNIFEFKIFPSARNYPCIFQGMAHIFLKRFSFLEEAVTWLIPIFVPALQALTAPASMLAFAPICSVCSITWAAAWR